MRPHIDKMRENVAQTLHLPVERVNIKATTEEGLGFTGSGEGISAQAVCLLEEALEQSVIVADSAERNCNGCPGCRKKEM